MKRLTILARLRNRIIFSNLLVAGAGALLIWLHPAGLGGRLFMTAALLLAAFVLGMSISKDINNKIKGMVWYTKEVSSGTFYGRLKLKGDDELVDLGRNINLMAGELTEKIDALTREKTTLEAVLAGMAEGVLVTDKDGRVILANRSLRETFGIKKEDTLGRPFLEVIRNMDISGLIQEAYRSHQMATAEVEMRQPREMCFMAGSVPLIMREEFAGTVLVLHDVTRLKALERVRRDFVANVTHELKTPISAIQGFSETLLSGALDEKENARRFLQIIETNSRRLARLIEDLLTLSKIELGEIRIEPRPVSLRKVSAEAAALLDPRIREKGLDLTLDVPDDAGVSADRDRLYQIILNVLDNSVKYTPEGGSITIKATAGGGGEGVVELLITDTGAGIPGEMLPRIGERFFRVDVARSRELGGTGLGLAIVKHLMMAHDGTFAIESLPGKGTTVSLGFKAARL